MRSSSVSWSRRSQCVILSMVLLCLVFFFFLASIFTEPPLEPVVVDQHRKSSKKNQDDSGGWFSSIFSRSTGDDDDDNDSGKQKDRADADDVGDDSVQQGGKKSEHHQHDSPGGFFSLLSQIHHSGGACNLNISDSFIVSNFLPQDLRSERNLSAAAVAVPTKNEQHALPEPHAAEDQKHEQPLGFQAIQLDQRPIPLGVVLTPSPHIFDHHLLRSNRHKNRKDKKDSAEVLYQNKRKKAIREIKYDLKHNQHRCVITRPFSSVPLYPLTLAEYRAPFVEDDLAVIASSGAVPPRPFDVSFSWRELARFNFDSAFVALTRAVAEQQEKRQQKKMATSPDSEQQQHQDSTPAPETQQQQQPHQHILSENDENDNANEDGSSSSPASIGGASRPLTPTAEENLRIYFALKYVKQHRGEVPDEHQFHVWLRNISSRTSVAAQSSLRFCNLATAGDRSKSEQHHQSPPPPSSSSSSSPGDDDEESEARRHAQQLQHAEQAQIDKQLRQEHQHLLELRKSGQSPPPVVRRWSLRPLHKFTAFVDKTRVWEHLIPDVRASFPTEIERSHAAGARMLAILVAILEKHNLKTYFLSHGSLLGAYRSGGMIPWDVDVDIAMPENHMKHLRKVWRSEFPRDMFLQTELTEPGFQMYTARRSQIRIKDRYSCSFGVPSMITRGKNTRVKLRKTHHGFGIDIIPLEKRKGGREYKVLHHFFNTSDIFPLSTVSVNGVLVPAPRRSAKLLRRLYGDDFATSVKHPPAHFGGTESFPCLSMYSCPGSSWSLNWTADRSSSDLRLLFGKSSRDEQHQPSLRGWQQQILQERARSYEQCTLWPRDDPNSH